MFKTHRLTLSVKCNYIRVISLLRLSIKCRCFSLPEQKITQRGHACDFTRLFAKFLPLLFNTCTSLITGTFGDSNLALIWLFAETFIQPDISVVNFIKMCNVLIKIQKTPSVSYFWSLVPYAR